MKRIILKQGVEPFGFRYDGENEFTFTKDGIDVPDHIGDRIKELYSNLVDVSDVIEITGEEPEEELKEIPTEEIEKPKKGRPKKTKE
jgi:hypothetical protein